MPSSAKNSKLSMVAKYKMKSSHILTRPKTHSERSHAGECENNLFFLCISSGWQQKPKIE